MLSGTVFLLEGYPGWRFLSPRQFSTPSTTTVVGSYPQLGQRAGVSGSTGRFVRQSSEATRTSDQSRHVSHLPGPPARSSSLVSRSRMLTGSPLNTLTAAPTLALEGAHRLPRLLRVTAVLLARPPEFISRMQVAG